MGSEMCIRDRSQSQKLKKNATGIQAEGDVTGNHIASASEQATAINTTGTTTIVINQNSLTVDDVKRIALEVFKVLVVVTCQSVNLNQHQRVYGRKFVANDLLAPIKALQRPGHRALEVVLAVIIKVVSKFHNDIVRGN